jgi:hypothetical protein
VISPSQGCYLHTGQHKHRINAHTDIHALSGIRTHDPSFRASEDISCLRPRGHCDWPLTGTIHPSIHLWLDSPLFGLGRFLNFLIFYTVGRTPWTGDQPVAWPIPTHRTIQTQNKRTHTHTDIHALSEIRTHHLSVRASKDNSCLRPGGHCDRPLIGTTGGKLKMPALRNGVRHE